MQSRGSENWFRSPSPSRKEIAILNLRVRPLRFTDRLALCAVAIPLFILYARWARADDPCPMTQKKAVACVKFGNADCTTYGVDVCTSKTMTVIFVGDFDCGSSGTNLTTCVPLADSNGVVEKGDCTKEYQCILNATEDKCIQGDQKGNTVQAVLYITKDCPKSGE